MESTNSTLFKAPNTSRPMPKPSGRVMPGARNFNHASMKLMAPTKPIHKKTAAIAMGYFMVKFIR